MELIGWIFISICCFYIVRNFYVGSVMFPAGKHIVMIYNRSVGKFYLHVHPICRNYYLLVLNPFLWKFLDIYINDEEGMKIKVLWKRFSDEQKKFKKN